MTAPVYVSKPLVRALVEAAWDEVVAEHPLPDDSRGREKWLLTHKPLLRATYQRMAAQ